MNVVKRSERFQSFRKDWSIVLITMLLFLFCFPMSMAGAAPATTIESYDVIVFGSEIQGMLLAQEARTLGLNVLVLDPRSRPGGELIQGQMFFLDDVNDNRKNSLVQGEIKHLFDGYKAGTIRKADEFQQYYDRIAKGIPLKSSIVIESVNISANNGMKSLKTLTYRDKAGVRHTVQAKYWVENSDFSGLTGKLGEKRIPGMESLYNSKKPDYMAATYMLNFKKVNWSKLHQAILEDYPLTHVRAKYGPNTYVDWHFATGFSNLTQNFATNDPQLRLRGLNAVYQRDGQVIINALLIYNVDPSNPALIKSALRKGRAQAPQILAFLRKNIPGFSNAELNGYPEYLYIRDYNRYQTKYVLDYPDLTSGKMFWDNVSIGGYSIDLQGTSAIPTGIGFGKPNRYGIPLRSFELRSYDNVLVIGKNIGATIKAYGSARIMPTNALAAQTIGIILGRERNKQLDELTESDFKRIHSYLKKDYHIVLK